MENGNSDDARVLAGPAACKRYSGPKPPSPRNRKKKIIFALNTTTDWLCQRNGHRLSCQFEEGSKALYYHDTDHA